MTPVGRRTATDEKLDATVGGAVTGTEKDDILASFEDSGFANQSAGIRVTSLAFALDVDVRHAVAKAIRKHKLLPGV